MHILLRPLPVAVSAAYFLANSCFILYIVYMYVYMYIYIISIFHFFVAHCYCCSLSSWPAFLLQVVYGTARTVAATEKSQRLAVLSSGDCFLGCFALIATLRRLWVIYERSLALATLANINTNTITTQIHTHTHRHTSTLDWCAWSSAGNL